MKMLMHLYALLLNSHAYYVFLYYLSDCSVNGGGLRWRSGAVASADSEGGRPFKQKLSSRRVTAARVESGSYLGLFVAAASLR